MILFVDARRWSESLCSAKRFIGEKQLVWGSVKVLLKQNGCSVWERKEDAEEGGWLIYHLESWLMITVYHNQHLWHTTSRAARQVYPCNSHTGSLLPIPHTPAMGWKWSGHVYVVERTLLLTREFPMADHHLQSRMPSTPAISPTPLPSATKQENKFEFPIIPNVWQHVVPISTVWTCVRVCLSLCVTPCECFWGFFFPYVCSSDTGLFVHTLTPSPWFLLPLTPSHPPSSSLSPHLWCLSLRRALPSSLSLYFSFAFLGYKSDLRQT